MDPLRRVIFFFFISTRPAMGRTCVWRDGKREKDTDIDKSEKQSFSQHFPVPFLFLFPVFHTFLHFFYFIFSVFGARLKHVGSRWGRPTLRFYRTIHPLFKNKPLSKIFLKKIALKFIPRYFQK